MTDQYEIRTTGETAPAGKYFCDKCGLEYEQKDESQALPDCPAEEDLDGLEPHSPEDPHLLKYLQ